MISLRCILFNDHKIIEKKAHKENNMVESTFVCSRCGKSEQEIMNVYNFKSEDDVIKILNNKLFKI
jgi:hypothetical protein